MPSEIALDDLFAEFHHNNPEVYDELVALARRWKHGGHHRVGIGMLWEVLRWNRALAGVGDAAFKMNNSYRSRYARLIMRQEADLVDFFEIRALTT